ncbi:Deafness [Mactra antiquata]
MFLCCCPTGSELAGSEVVYNDKDRTWSWKPFSHIPQQKYVQQHRQVKMVETKRSETVLRNLAHELLNDEECIQFKQALHHFRVSHSVTTLCQQLIPVINSTSKLLLLVELSMRMPSNLQEDFHQLCSLQYPNYDSYLKLFTSGNSAPDMPRIIAQDSNGKLKIVSKGTEKKMFMRYNNQKQAYELRSIPGTSVTSGVYSNGSGNESDFDEVDAKENQGRVTPVHLVGKKNTHKVILNRHDDGSLGLGITGGKEYGTELVINVVEEGGPAATQGLQIGDKILEVNGHNFHNITHSEAVMIMRHAWNLIILIERPGESTEEDETDTHDEVDSPRRQLDNIKDFELVVHPADTGRLGCVTQRLASQDLLVKQVEAGSPAALAGVQLHDLIYKIDSISVRELSEKQIIMLTNAKRINLHIRRYVPTNDVMGERSRSRQASVSVPAYRTLSESRSNDGRDISPESHHSSHHSSHHPTKYFRSRSAYFPHPNKDTNQPERLVYGDKPRQANWIISPKQREHRYTQRREIVSTTNAHSFPVHGRSRSEGRNEYIYRHSQAARDSVNAAGRRSRYIRNRSQSPHRNTIQRVHHEDNVIRAIQMGLEKRQRAIRRSLYQMPDPVDYEWEI